MPYFWIGLGRYIRTFKPFAFFAFKAIHEKITLNVPCERTGLLTSFLLTFSLPRVKRKINVQQPIIIAVKKIGITEEGISISDESKMPDFIKTFGTLIVAGIALIQPWFISAWKKFVRRQSIEVYEAGAMEIGFGALGPTIGLQGTARAINRDAFIHSITLKITREKDKAEHNFQWGIFRPPALVPPQQTQFEICSGFLLTENSPRRLSVLFFEPEAVDEMRPNIELFRQSWSKKIAESPIQEYFKQLKPNQPFPTEAHQFFQKLYREYSSEKVSVDTFSALSRMFYWEQSSYRAHLQIHTAHPNKTYTFPWRFEITQQNAEVLRSNLIKVLMETCGQPTGGYNSVFPSYMPISQT